MVSSGLSWWFLSFISYACIFSITMVHAVEVYSETGYPGHGDSGHGHGHYYETGINVTCGKNLQITNLTTADTYVGLVPFYDEETYSLYYGDPQVAKVYRYDISSQKTYHIVVGEKYAVDMLLPLKNRPGQFLFNNLGKLNQLSWNGKSNLGYIRTIMSPDPSHPDNYLDKAKVAPNGAIVLFSDPKVSPTSQRTLTAGNNTGACSLITIHNGEVKTLVSKLDYVNGLAFNSDGTRLYFSEAISNIAYKTSYNQKTNSIGKLEVLFKYSDLNLQGTLNSITVDTKGYIWMALTGTQRIIKVDPNDGKVVCSVETPEHHPYDLIFGKCPGEKSRGLKCLYVTTGTSRVPEPLVLIEGLGSEGFPQLKADWNKVFKKNYGRYD